MKFTFANEVYSKKLIITTIFYLLILFLPGLKCMHGFNMDKHHVKGLLNKNLRKTLYAKKEEANSLSSPRKLENEKHNAKIKEVKQIKQIKQIKQFKQTKKIKQLINDRNATFIRINEGDKFDKSIIPIKENIKENSKTTAKKVLEVMATASNKTNQILFQNAIKANKANVTNKINEIAKNTIVPSNNTMYNISSTTSIPFFNKNIPGNSRPNAANSNITTNQITNSTNNPTNQTNRNNTIEVNNSELLNTQIFYNNNNTNSNATNANINPTTQDIMVENEMKIIDSKLNRITQLINNYESIDNSTQIPIQQQQRIKSKEEEIEDLKTFVNMTFTEINLKDIKKDKTNQPEYISDVTV